MVELYLEMHGDILIWVPLCEFYVGSVTMENKTDENVHFPGKQGYFSHRCLTQGSSRIKVRQLEPS